MKKRRITIWVVTSGATCAPLVAPLLLHEAIIGLLAVLGVIGILGFADICITRMCKKDE